MMKRTMVLLLAALGAAMSAAQDVKESDVSPATKQYHEYRQRATEPPYALQKVKALIKAIKPAKGKDGDDQILASSAWGRMSTAERFTYCMLHGEVSSQNCEMMPWVVDEDHKVFASPPPFNEGQEDWSDRQTAFLKGHRAAVIGMLRATMTQQGRVGVNLKNAITTLDAYELVPDVVKVYEKDRKDQDLLSVLAILMKDGKDKPFLASATYRKLYGPDANYQSFIVANEANQKLMIDRATAFYRTKVR